MKIRAILEISPQIEADQLRSLLALAYQASRSGTIVLGLSGLSPQACDRMLDPVVAATGMDVEGILYLDACAPDLIRLATGADAVFVASGQLRARLYEAGLLPLDMEAASAFFATPESRFTDPGMVCGAHPTAALA